MYWALRRQFLIAVVVVVVAGLVLLGLWFTFFYRAPSCFDGVQDGGEQAVDCGGPCARLCTVPTVTALWAHSVEAGPGVYHAVALVQNPETDAGTASLPYTFSLYDSTNILVAERSGVMYLNPGEVAPLFEPDIVTGNRTPAYTFVSFGPAVWETMDHMTIPVTVTSQSLDSTALKLTAYVQNTSALPVSTFTATALLYDANGNLVTASQTTLDGLDAHEGKNIVFTWQEPFSAPIVTINIIPRLVQQQ